MMMLLEGQMDIEWVGPGTYVVGRREWGSGSRGSGASQKMQPWSWIQMEGRLLRWTQVSHR